MATNIGLYIRVSTDRQARIDEGSLKSQKQRLEDWVELSNKAYYKDYKIYKMYQDVETGTTTQRPDYQKMQQDIRTGKLGAIVSISISRLNRSLRDFYTLQDLCEKHGVAILSLKENFDTSTAIGRALLKFMLVFYELESEQTGERVSDNQLARANRGLWTASRIFGYNPAHDKKGYLEPDALHSKTVEFIFDSYLECGSISMVREKLKEKGLKTASYTTEKGREREAQNFADETIRHILSNLAYIGKGEIGKTKKKTDQSKLPENKRYRIVEGLWPPLVGEEIFYQVQEILKRNSSSKTNSISPDKKKHFILAGLVICGECASTNGEPSVPMITGSGTSKSGKSYYYYRCKQCKRRIKAEELEDYVHSKLSELSKDTKKLKKFIDNTNRIVTEELPRLKSQLTELQNLRKQKEYEIDQLLLEGRQLGPSQMKNLLQSKGEKIALEMADINKAIDMKDEEIAKQNSEKVDSQLVKETLTNFSLLYKEFSPHDQQQIMRILVDNVTNSDHEIRINIDGGIYIAPKKKGPQSVFSETPIGRAESVSQRFLLYHTFPLFGDVTPSRRS